MQKEKNGKLGLVIVFGAVAFLMCGAPLLAKPVIMEKCPAGYTCEYVSYDPAPESAAGEKGCTHQGLYYPAPRFDCSQLSDGKEPRDTWE